MKRYFFLIGLFIFAISIVSGLGVTPGQKMVNYEQGTVQELSIDVVNSESTNANIVLLPQGELNASLALSTYSFTFSSNIPSQHVPFTFTVPSGLTPGRHNAEILVLQVPTSQGGNSQNIATAVVGVISKISVDVNYPGKYLDSIVQAVPESSKVSFVVPVISKGNLDIARAKAVIEIYTSLNKKVDTISTNEISIPSGGHAELAAVWDTKEIPPGPYRAVVALVYDEQTTTLQTNFVVGGETLQLKTVTVNDFTLGGIAKFEFLVEHHGSAGAKDAYIQMQVFNNKKEVMADFKSATYDIAVGENKLMTAFWDTEGVKKGNYDSRAVIHVGEESLQHDLKLKVSDSEISVVGIGYVVKSATTSGSSSSSLVTILVIGIIVLVLLNAVWFLMLRKKLVGRAIHH